MLLCIFTAKKNSLNFFFGECVCENTMFIFSYLSPETVAIITLVQSLNEGEKN